MTAQDAPAGAAVDVVGGVLREAGHLARTDPLGALHRVVEADAALERARPAWP